MNSTHSDALVFFWSNGRRKENRLKRRWSCLPGAAISIDVGDQDRLRDDTEKLHQALEKYAIANTFEVYRGTHTSAVSDGFQNHALKFFSQNLCLRQVAHRRQIL
jgi:acetyl esterase/lipase